MNRFVSSPIVNNENNTNRSNSSQVNCSTTTVLQHYSLLCNLCHGILLDPVYRPSCAHSYCRDCIIDWLTRQGNNYCPVDRQPLTLNYLMEVPVHVKNILNDLKVKCQFYREGCTKEIRLKDIKEHQDSCLFNPSVPMTDKVNQVLSRSKDFASHGHSSRSHLTCPTTKLLLQLLEDKEAIVKQQERIISQMIEEGDRISDVVKDLSVQKEKVKEEAQRDIDKLKQIIKQLEEEDSQLRNRLTGNRIKLIRDCLASMSTASNSIDLLEIRSEDGPLSLPVIAHTSQPPGNKNLLSPTSPTAGVFRSGSAVERVPGSRSRSPSIRRLSVFDSRRKSIGSRSPNRQWSRRTGRRRSSNVLLTASAEQLNVSADHLEVMMKLKLRLSESLYRAMESVDLADYYQFDPYQIAWVSYLADRIARLEKHVKEGSRILVLNVWSDLYIVVILGILVSSNGIVVARTVSEDDVEKVSRTHPYLIQDGILVFKSDQEMSRANLVDYSNNPFNVIFVTRDSLTPNIRDLASQNNAVIFDPYDNVIIQTQ